MSDYAIISTKYVRHTAVQRSALSLGLDASKAAAYAGSRLVKSKYVYVILTLSSY